MVGGRRVLCKNLKGLTRRCSEFRRLSDSLISPSDLLPVMPKKRLTLSKTTEKRAFQQAGSVCGFCPEHEIASLQIHHIDGNPANNVLQNLLIVCATCHTKITGGVISEADVRTKKREIEWLNSQRAVRQCASVSVNITGSTFRGDIAQNLTKISTSRQPRITHPSGSLGADLRKRGYIDYLLARYFEFRRADRSYGPPRPFSHAEIHRTIQSEFGHKTFFMPVEFFERLAAFLQSRIDRTILGRNNSSRRIPNYHSYEEHLLEQDAQRSVM